ncbi:hypothetical protein OSTOST_19955 [Ostertagia ostertagi]
MLIIPSKRINRPLPRARCQIGSSQLVERLSNYVENDRHALSGPLRWWQQ